MRKRNFIPKRWELQKGVFLYWVNFLAPRIRFNALKFNHEIGKPSHLRLDPAIQNKCGLTTFSYITNLDSGCHMGTTYNS